MSNPKLEFFRFKLNHKSGENKTFRQFMSDLGKCTAEDPDNAIFANLYKYFMEKPENGFATNDSIKKTLTLISNPQGKVVNKYYDKRPLPKFSDYIISGVMNGGPYGKERIVSNLSAKDELGNLGASQTVLQYYYIFVYLPLNHYEGFFMIHSDSVDESITQAARSYITKLFTEGEYRKPIMRVFAPQKFREEYKNGAKVTSVTFQSTIVDDQIEEQNPMKDSFGEYNVKITLTPKGEGEADMGKLEQVKSYFNNLSFASKY